MMECKEATSLESYFLFLANFSHDRAREVRPWQDSSDMCWVLVFVCSLRDELLSKSFSFWGGGNWDEPAGRHLGPPGFGWEAVPWSHLSPGGADGHDDDDNYDDDEEEEEGDNDEGYDDDDYGDVDYDDDVDGDDDDDDLDGSASCHL